VRTFTRNYSILKWQATKDSTDRIQETSTTISDLEPRGEEIFIVKPAKN
jgi:hypothetical protein